MRQSSIDTNGKGTSEGNARGVGGALVAVGAAVARVEPSLPTVVRRSLVRRFLLGAVGFAVVVPAVALALPSTAASVGFVVAAGLVGGTLGFCECYYVLVGAERRLDDHSAGDASSKPESCIRVDEVGDLLDAVEGTVDDYERRLRDAEAARDHAVERSEAYEARVDDWAAAASETARAVADGDLERRLDDEDAPAGVADLTAAFDAMLDELESTLFNVEAFVEEVDRAAIEAAEAGNAVTGRAERVAERAERVAGRLDRQQRDVERAAGTAEDLSAGLEDVESTIAGADDGVEAAVESAAGVEAAVGAISDELDDVSATLQGARAGVDDVEASADELGERLDAFEELSEQAGRLALNATIHAARAEARGLAGAERFRTLAGEAVVLADATDDWIAGCLTSLAAVRDGVDDVSSTLTTADVELSAAHERVDDATAETETLRDDAGVAHETVRDAGRSVERLCNPAGHLVGVLDRVVDRNETTADRADALASRIESVHEETSALGDDLATVRTQTGFLEVQTRGLATRDVESVRSPGTATRGD